MTFLFTYVATGIPEISGIGFSDSGAKDVNKEKSVLLEMLEMKLHILARVVEFSLLEVGKVTHTGANIIIT